MSAFKRIMICTAMIAMIPACSQNLASSGSNESQSTPAQLASRQEVDQFNAQDIVDRSRNTVETISSEHDFVGIKDLISKAKGVLIFPQLVRGGFFVGGEGGVGVVMIRQADGSWGYPAFYNLVGGSLGLQIGVESTETLFLIMTQKGLNSIIKNQFKLGADVSVAVGPLGGGLGASKSSPDFASDMYVYSKATGLFGGGALKGGIITVREDLNKAYYSSDASAKDILTDKRFNNSGADRLRSALSLDQPSDSDDTTPIPAPQY